MRDLSINSFYLSIAGIALITVALSSCSGPERLQNDDISLDATKELVRERLIAPIDDERIINFNKKLPRRSILQVVHSPQSLSDPSFLRIVESQLSEEIKFRELQDDLAGEKILPANLPKPLTADEKIKKRSEREVERNQFVIKKALILEEALFKLLSDMEPIVEDLLLNTVPLRSNVDSFPEVIGANLTEDPNGYLSMPSNMVLIGGEGSTFTSKTASLSKFVTDKQLSLSVRELPIEEAIGIVADALNIEHTFSIDTINNSSDVSLSLRSNGLAILDAILTQHELAMMYDSNLKIARFYRDEELSLIQTNIKEAILGHNELLKAKKELKRAQSDIVKIKQMIEITQQLLSGNNEAFKAGITGFPRNGMGILTREALKTLTEENLKLTRQLASFDEETESLLDPSKKTITNKLRQQTSGLSLNDMLVENDCIAVGKELFVEKIAVYNIDAADAVSFLKEYFDNNVNPDVTEANEENDGDDGNEDIVENIVDAADEAITDALEDVLEVSADEEVTDDQSDNDESSDCPDYKMTFQVDSTGIIVKGRHFDNSLAARLIEEYDVPRLQVLVEIFMVTVSRDFNRQISNLITSASNSRGGNNVAEAALDGTTLATPSGPAASATIPNILTQISSAIAGGYSVRLNSPATNGSNVSLISSALGFIESNQLGRVLSSPTILVENGTKKAKISRTLEALVGFDGATTDNGTSVAADEIEEYDAEFSLELNDVQVYAANRTVNMAVTITNERFVLSDIQLIRERDQADKITDKIETTFTASPGDVIVLAGLSANSEGATTSGLPGTTGALAPVSPLLGGSDQVTSNASEMIIFLAPTVIDPAADFQPHSAFGARAQ